MNNINKVLIANRGEIALRIIRTCRKMGVLSVAVYSDADASSPHVRAADETVRIGPAPSVESYLVAEKLIDAAQKTGADAIHPGYGFLAENANFAQACADAGIIFIGPNPNVIEKMGSKKISKEIVAQAGVPVIPGYNLDDENMTFPVLLKASAGGGGKGMRIVREASELPSAVEGAKREALNAFGDDTLLIERYIDQPRHIEVQVLGDHQGNLVHVFERECSIQRRHQKIIEESPSPALTEELRQKICAAGVTVASAIGYQSAGTVEFVYSASGEFFFLEVNTRLQVEHPVTEYVSGLDLVAEQIRIAQGQPLPFTQADLSQRGSAIEVRIYAEDPEQGFLPVTGRLSDWNLPEMDNVRLDSGVEIGSEVSIHYDPMLAKLIAYGETRSASLRKMRYALEQFSIGGLTTNQSLLLAIMNDEQFQQGDFDTHYLDKRLADLTNREPKPSLRINSAIAVALSNERFRHSGQSLNSIPSGFRNNLSHGQVVKYQVQSQTYEMSYVRTREGAYSIECEGDTFVIDGVDWQAPYLRFVDQHGVGRRFRVLNQDSRYHCHSTLGSTEIELLPRFPKKTVELMPGACVAPMPGKVIAIKTELGMNVSQGQPLLILEAMKMEHTVSAPTDGIVESLSVQVGDQVDALAVLVVVTPAEE